MTSPTAEPSDADLPTADQHLHAHDHAGGSDNPCQSALDGLHQYVDGEMSEAGRRQMEMHLRDCIGCENVFGFEVQVKRLIATRGQTRCPDEVRARLTTVIHTYALETQPDA